MEPVSGRGHNPVLRYVAYLILEAHPRRSDEDNALSTSAVIHCTCEQRKQLCAVNYSTRDLLNMNISMVCTVISFEHMPASACCIHVRLSHLS